jgi:preprotein translocase subunit SecD
MRKKTFSLAAAVILLTGCSNPFDKNSSTEKTTAPTVTTQEITTEAPTIPKNEIYFRIGEDASTEPILTSKNIANVTMEIVDEEINGSTYTVSLTLDEEGSEIFARATEQAAADHSAISIWYNEYLINVSTVNEPITSGAAYISGLDMASACKVTGWIYECMDKPDTNNSSEGE